MFLKREIDEYFIYVLGINGDPIAKKTLEVSAFHMDKNEHIQTLVTNKKGRVALGSLANINNISATLTDVGTKTWLIIN
jgi:5-hydroxyisourate hydrolase-like protein (transthyretin family)